MPTSSQLWRRDHRHTGDRSLHPHVQPPYGSSVRMEEGCAFLQAAEGQDRRSPGTGIGSLRNTGNYDPDEVLACVASKQSAHCGPRPRGTAAAVAVMLFDRAQGGTLGGVARLEIVFLVPIRAPRWALATRWEQGAQIGLEPPERGVSQRLPRSSSTFHRCFVNLQGSIAARPARGRG